MSVRLEDNGKTLYLFTEQQEAERDAVLLARGHLERFAATRHTSELGWFITDKESGRIYDAQGLVR